MNLKPTALTALFVLALSACSQQAETSVAPAAPASAETAAAPEVQSLNSRDGALTINTVGTFADQSGRAELTPDGVSADEITLLQRDEQSGITLYAVALGTPKKAAAEYFAGLKADLENLSDISGLKIGAATENRMDYSYSAGDELLEHCIAVHTGEQLYSVCANGSGVSAEQLSAVLKDVRLNKTMP